MLERLWTRGGKSTDGNLELEEHDHEINYRRRSENCVADYLSHSAVEIDDVMIGDKNKNSKRYESDRNGKEVGFSDT